MRRRLHLSWRPRVLLWALVFVVTVASPPSSRADAVTYSRQADACVVSRDAFETARELNPQVGRELHILARSPRLLAMVFSLGTHLTEIHRRALAEPLLEAHQDRGFEEIVTLDKVQRLMRVPDDVPQSTMKVYSRGEAPATVDTFNKENESDEIR